LKRKTYFLFFAIILILGLLGLLDFYITTYKIGFGKVGVNPIFLGLLILFFMVSKDEMNVYSKNRSEEEEITLNENLIKSFEIRFARKTIQELNEIANADSKYTLEGKEAAKRVLIKRKAGNQL